jgi:nicotinamide-nucleotide amidase
MRDNLTVPKGKTDMLRVRTVSVFGLTKSATAAQLSEFKRLFPHSRLKLRAKFPIVRVKIQADGPNPVHSKDLLEDGIQWVCQRLGNEVFSDSGQSMEQVVGMLLHEKKATLAVAESCTGGLIANLLTDVPGSSDYFLLSAVTYANQAKMKILDVSTKTLEKNGAVSEQTAREMAMGAKNVVDATYGLATSGIAGPGGGTDDKPVGTVCIGLATPLSATAHRFYFPHHNRKRTKYIFAITALDLLRRELLNA